MSAIENMLAQFPFLGTLKPATLQAITPLLTPIQVAAGEVLYTQGNLPTGLYWVTDGYVFLYRQSQDKSQILALINAGECFGGESIANNKPSPYTAKALTLTTVYQLAPQDLQMCILKYPDFMSLFLNLVTQRLRQLTVLVHDLAFRDVSARLARILLMLIEAQGQPSDIGILLPKIVSQQELASMVGTAREVIYRTLKRFEKDHILHNTRPAYLILNLEALREIANEEVK